MPIRQLALLALTATTVVAQTPPRRAHHSLVYDAAGKRVLLWGGSSPHENGDCCAFFNDLWAFDGTRWTSLGESGARVSGVGLAYDARQNRVVAFGGYTPGPSGGVSIGDIRTLENDTWKVHGQHPEITAAEPGFVYDIQRQRFVTFGGSGGRGLAHGQLWEWDGTSWHRATAEGPRARQAHVMVFDSRRNRMVVFGGMGTISAGQPPERFGDTWEFDGRTWQQFQVAGPPARAAAGATFDSKRGVVVIFGGMTDSGMLGDTWAWNGAEWRKLADSGPDARAMGHLAYDAHRDRVVLFGGRKGWPNDLNDTWEWDGTAWHRVATRP
ncbi:MAG TPA: hypothetical protein VFZ73_04225 [Gemmatimonadaceae bacterium]